MQRNNHIGPIHYHYLREKRTGKHFLDIWIWEGCGWMWGSDQPMENKIYVSVAMFGLTIIHIERWKGGWEIAFMGFWWIK